MNWVGTINIYLWFYDCNINLLGQTLNIDKVNFYYIGGFAKPGFLVKIKARGFIL